MSRIAGAASLVDLIALVFWIADRDAQQNFRIEELQKAWGQGIGGIVDVGWPNGAVRSDQAEIGAGPLSCRAVHSGGEGLYVVPFQARGGSGVRRRGRMRSDAYVVMMRGVQSSGHGVEQFRFHRLPFNARLRRADEEAAGSNRLSDSQGRNQRCACEVIRVLALKSRPRRKRTGQQLCRPRFSHR